MKWVTKKTLAMFIVTFRQDEDINRIYGRAGIQSMRVSQLEVRGWFRSAKGARPVRGNIATVNQDV